MNGLSMMISSSDYDTVMIKEKINGYSRYQYIVKRGLELFIVFWLMIITIPLGMYVIYRIKRESKGNIFFLQQRVGYKGKKFTCYKFRSMYENSSHNPYTEENDQRIFPFGHIMRKMRIDELPQLWNVLKGEMHLIGPRAEWDILEQEYNLKIQNYSLRHLVKPGITGLAQVCYPYGRNLQDSKNKLQYDLSYIKNWSLGLEFRIIIKTIKVVFGKEGT